jgi:outer membrane protein TolC
LRQGTIDLVTVLQTQQTLYQAEDALAQARLAHVQAIVSLYQALGGGWLPKPLETSDAR